MGSGGHWLGPDWKAYIRNSEFFQGLVSVKATLLTEREELRYYRGPDGTGWICDRCGEVIETAGDGWLQWVGVPDESDGPTMRGLSLVHHFPASPRKQRHEDGCQFDPQEFRKDRGIVKDMHLDAFCGADGLMLFLSLISQKAASVAEILEMVKRIHIPGNERARSHFEHAIAEGVIGPNLPEGFYWQSDIRAVLDCAKRESERG